MIKKNKKVLIILGCVVVTPILVYFGFDLYAKYASSKVSYEKLDLSRIDDGMYEGSYHITPVVVKVRVHIMSSKITDIEIVEHQTGLGEKAESIVDSIIKEQDINVDCVSGATVSSNTILKAVENALTPGGNNE